MAADSNAPSRTVRRRGPRDPRTCAGPTRASRSTRSTARPTSKGGTRRPGWGSPGSSPTPGASAPTCTGAALDDAPVRRLRHGRRRPTSASSSCSAPGQTGLSCAFDLPTQMGHDSDHPRAEGEVGKVGVAIDSLADMRLLLADLPLDKVTTSMTINATAAILLLFYQLVAEENGVDPGPPGRHHPERHPEGVRGPGHLHLPAAAVHAAGDRHVRLLRRATCRRGTPSRSPATTSARPARRPCRRSPSPSPTASPTSRPPSPPAWTSTTSRPGSASSGTPTTTCSRRSPSTGPPAGCGRGS